MDFSYTMQVMLILYLLEKAKWQKITYEHLDRNSLKEMYGRRIRKLKKTH